MKALSTKEATKMQRDLKAYFSSDFENLLLKMTKPDEYRPLNTDVNRFVATVESFVRNLDCEEEENPYRVTLRKLWSKMQEN